MPDEPRYPIGAVSLLTGIPVDTLRAWERRHAAVEPHRDPRGRLYRESDVERLRMLRTLVERGHAISRIAGLPPAELSALAGGAPAGAPAPGAIGQPAIDAVLRALERYDAAAADRELRRIAALLPPREFVRDIAMPLVHQVGDGWYAGRFGIAQEHLAAALLRDLLGTLGRLHAPHAPRASLLFATPPGERHEFGILGAAMLASVGGLGAIYLGPDLPASEVVRAAKATGARAVVLGLIGARGARRIVQAIRDTAAGLPPRVELWLGGPHSAQFEAAAAEAKAAFLHDFDVFEEQLMRLGATF